MTVRDILESPSKTLAIMLAVFCFGLVFGLFLPFGWSKGLLAIGFVFLVFGLFPLKQEIRFLLILSALFFLALFRSNLVFSPTLLSVGSVPSSTVIVQGRVHAQVERRLDAQRIVLDQVRYGEQAREGKLLVWAPLYPVIGYGDQVTFNCQVKRPEPFNGFAYDRHLATQGIFAVCSLPLYLETQPSRTWSVTGGLLVFKEALLTNIERVIPQPHAAFLSGLLFGGSSALSRQIKDDFSSTGLTHILAASGFNISLFSVAFLSFILSTGIGRRRGLVVSLVLLVSYVVMAGATPAVVRAGCMGALVVVQKWISRKAFLLNLFLLTGTMMLVVEPLLLYDVGFQLSFVATIAVVVFTKPVSEFVSFIPERFGLRETFSASLAAIGLTLPLILWHFGQVSVIAPFTNVWVLPFVPYAMVLTLIVAFAGFLGTGVSMVFALPAWALSEVMLTFVRWFGSIPFASVVLEHNRFLAIFVAAVLFCFWLYRFYVSSKT